MNHRWMRLAVGSACRASLCLASAERSGRQGLVILCYHRVLPREQKTRYWMPDLVVTPEALRRHCLALRRFYDVLPLCEAFQALQTPRPRRRPFAAITFDDGYRDNLRYAAPILGETGIRATFFIIADLIGVERAPWYDQMACAVLECQRQKQESGRGAISRLVDDNGRNAPGDDHGLPARVVEHAKRLAPAKRQELLDELITGVDLDAGLSPDDHIMNWNELRELSDAGHEIGSHGRSHQILTQVDVDDGMLESEVRGSRCVLEDGLGRPVSTFCYPNGDASDREAEAVAKAGYTCAVTVDPGSNGPGVDPYRLRRRFVHEDRLAGPLGTASSTLLRLELSGLADRVFFRPRTGTEQP